MKYDLADRTVAITGAAGGLGADLAKALRARGARIALLDLNPNAVCELADHLGGDSVARGWRADVRDFDNLDQVMTDVAAHFERLDVVVAGAGIGSAIGPITGMTHEEWERTIDVNLNVNISQQVVVRLASDVQQMIQQNPQAFPPAPTHP